jgi:nitroimidazol reductase NimA-like FMN-containing flavoprotein (pyridoxamine 5'-phosphate oxidase superfamily)
MARRAIRPVPPIAASPGVEVTARIGSFDPVIGCRHPAGSVAGTNGGPERTRAAGTVQVVGGCGKGDIVTTSLPLDHSGLGVLQRKECLERLAKARLGRVAFISQGDPVILPVNHGMDGENVIFRTATGTKLLAADTEQVVAFEVDGYDADRRTGWSVLVRGVATSVEDQEEVKRLNLLGVWPWADLTERSHWVRINTLSITGRQVVHPYRAGTY